MTKCWNKSTCDEDMTAANGMKNQLKRTDPNIEVERWILCL